MDRPAGIIQRPSHKLLRKLAPSRWRHARHIYSQERVFVADDMHEVEDNRDQLYHHYTLRSDQSHKGPETLQTEVNDTNQGVNNTSDPMHKTSLFPSPPPYKQGPIPPQRKSSANREAFVHYRKQNEAQRRSGTNKTSQADHQIAQDEISQGFDAFDDDLLQPEQSSQVARMASLFPAPARNSIISKSSSSKERRLPSLPTQSSEPSPTEPSPPRGRARKISPRNLSPKTSSVNLRTKTSNSNLRATKVDTIAPLSHRMHSPPRFDVPHNLTAPAILSPTELAQLQIASPDKSNIVNTELKLEDDPESWDLIQPTAKLGANEDGQAYSLERRAEELYSAEHLEIILEDKEFLHKFSQFLRSYRPWREPILTYYLSAKKATKALGYANALTSLLSEQTPPYDSVVHPPDTVTNVDLDLAAKEAFDELLRDDLHFYIAHVWIEMVSSLVQRRITGTLAPHLRDASTGLAEVFVITDPNREDSPIILASEMFSRHSGCSLEYIIGRNCRFLQGPCTTVDSCRRFAISNQTAKDHTEIFVNYRRDGTPFLSLVMNAPLLDSHGKVRYFLGAQVDVSGLLKDCSGLDSLSRLVEKRANDRQDSVQETDRPDVFGTVKALCESFSAAELSFLQKRELAPPQPEYKIHDTTPKSSHGGRVYIADRSDSDPDDQIEPSFHEDPISLDSPMSTGNLSGVYKYYLLVRPAPSLRILFASPTLREPGLLQTPFMNRIGGSARMRQDLDSALRASKPVTARVRWLKAANEDGDGDGTIRWIHCTPLLHYSNQVGMWMVVVVQPNREVAGSVYSDRSSRTRGRGRGEGSRTGSRR